jgi:hypothetical protein
MVAFLVNWHTRVVYSSQYLEKLNSVRVPISAFRVQRRGRRSRGGFSPGGVSQLSEVAGILEKKRAACSKT